MSQSHRTEWPKKSSYTTLAATSKLLVPGPKRLCSCPKDTRFNMDGGKCLSHVAATSLLERNSLYPGETNYLYPLTHRHHLHHHLTKGNLGGEGERHEAERGQHMEMRLRMPQWASVSGHLGGMWVMSPFLQLHHSGVGSQELSKRRGVTQVCQCSATIEHGLVPTTFRCAKSSSPKHKGSSKRGGFFLQNKLSQLFFPYHSLLETFCFTESQNDRSAFPTHFVLF